MRRRAFLHSLIGLPVAAGVAAAVPARPMPGELVVRIECDVSPIVTALEQAAASYDKFARSIGFSADELNQICRLFAVPPHLVMDVDATRNP